MNQELWGAKKYHNSYFINHNSLSKAFTLIELLVVISIIGILAALILASYSGAQARARDSHRKTDIDALKKSLELAREDTPGGYSYPEDINTLDDDPSSPYIQKVPTDPKSGQMYIYKPTQIDGTSTCSEAGHDCAKYNITACLENKNDSYKDDADTYSHSGCPVGFPASYTIISQ